MADNYLFVSGNTLTISNGSTYTNQTVLTVSGNLTVTGNVICNTIIVPGGGSSSSNSAFKARISTTNTVTLPYYLPSFPGFPPNPTPQYSNTFLLRCDAMVVNNTTAYNNTSNFAQFAGGNYIQEYSFGPNNAGLYNTFMHLNVYCNVQANITLSMQRSGVNYSSAFFYLQSGEQNLSLNDIVYLDGNSHYVSYFVTVVTSSSVNVTASGTGLFSYVGGQLIQPTTI